MPPRQPPTTPRQPTITPDQRDQLQLFALIFSGPFVLIILIGILGSIGQWLGMISPSGCDTAQNNRLTLDRHINDLQNSGQPVYGSTRQFADALRETESGACD